MLDVTLYDQSLSVAETFHSDDDDGVDYVSLVSDGTYGKPALIAPGKPGDARAAVGERVLYINTNIVPAFMIERVS